MPQLADTVDLHIGTTAVHVFLDCIAFFHPGAFWLSFDCHGVYCSADALTNAPCMLADVCPPPRESEPTRAPLPFPVLCPQRHERKHTTIIPTVREPLGKTKPM